MEMRLRAPVTGGYFFFSSALCASLTRLRREISIRKKYPLEPRVVHAWLLLKKVYSELVLIVLFFFALFFIYLFIFITLIFFICFFLLLLYTPTCIPTC